MNLNLNKYVISWNRALISAMDGIFEAGGSGLGDGHCPITLAKLSDISTLCRSKWCSHVYDASAIRGYLEQRGRYAAKMAANDK